MTSTPLRIAGGALVVVLVIVFMVQILPNTTDLGRKFPTLVYQALVEPSK